MIITLSLEMFFYLNDKREEGEKTTIMLLDSNLGRQNTSPAIFFTAERIIRFEM